VHDAHHGRAAAQQRYVDGELAVALDKLLRESEARRHSETQQRTFVPSNGSTHQL
jgi:hypothetical protein